MNGITLVIGPPSTYRNFIYLVWPDGRKNYRNVFKKEHAIGINARDVIVLPDAIKITTINVDLNELIIYCQTRVRS